MALGLSGRADHLPRCCITRSVASLRPLPSSAGWPLIIVAGLLVGFGTRYAGGCTSGHGVCGIGRLSPRSIAATATFIAAGMLTVAV